MLAYSSRRAEFRHYHALNTASFAYLSDFSSLECDTTCKHSANHIGEPSPRQEVSPLWLIGFTFFAPRRRRD